MFTLPISCLTTSNLPWFLELTFQVPMQYCSLQHWTLLPSPVTSTTGCCFCFSYISSFFLESFLHWSPVAYRTPFIYILISLTYCEPRISISIAHLRKLTAALSNLSQVPMVGLWWDFPGKNTGVGNMLLEISGEMTPERMKGWSQSKNNTQLWMRLVMEVKSDPVKSNFSYEQENLGPWIRQIGSGQTGDGKSEHQHFRNQRTKMDWNGWVKLRWPLYLWLWARIP